MPIADSAFIDTVVCESCGLTQFVRVRTFHAGVPHCRRCRLPLGVLYMDIQPQIASDHHELMRSVGALIRSMRLRCGWSQAALALHAATDRSRINRIERGHVLPPVGLLLRILALVGVGRIYFRLGRRADV